MRDVVLPCARHDLPLNDRCPPGERQRGAGWRPKTKNKISARQAAIDVLTEAGQPMKLGDLVTVTLKRAKGLKTDNAGDIVRVQVIRGQPRRQRIQACVEGRVPDRAQGRAQCAAPIESWLRSRRRPRARPRSQTPRSRSRAGADREPNGASARDSRKLTLASRDSASSCSRTASDGREPA